MYEKVFTFEFITQNVDTEKDFKWHNVKYETTATF